MAESQAPLSQLNQFLPYLKDHLLLDRNVDTPHYKTIYRAESTASSGKQKSPFRYLTQDPAKSICQPSDITTFRFLELRSFCSFCAIFSDKSVTVNVCKNVHRNPAASPSTAVAQPQANVRIPRTMAT
jgi:hypothetical protein